MKASISSEVQGQGSFITKHSLHSNQWIWLDWDNQGDQRESQSQAKGFIDHVPWLTVQVQDPKFNLQVKDIMSSLYSPLHLHPKLIFWS